MSDLVTRLKELGVQEDDCLTLNYTEGCDVWHINESHVQESVAETATASLLAGLLATGVPVYDTYGSAEPGNDILNEMRDNGVLDEYDYEGWFEEFLTEKLQESVYDQEYSIEYSTTQYDYKRGRCDISTEVRLRAGDLFFVAETDSPRFQFVSPDRMVRGFKVSVETPNGTLTLD
mgnify:CR=1 FL=1|jgi:hypothetical protein|tara:strand:- start:391 stop:918 length:528 start_codon:yes stop_codon:yes gene_type:complete